MKIDFDARLKNLNGEEIKRAEAKADGAVVMHDWSVGQMAADAILAPQPATDRGPLTPSQLTERYALALRLHAGGEVDLTAPEVVLIQTAVARVYAPLIAAQIVALTEGRDWKAGVRGKS